MARQAHQAALVYRQLRLILMSHIPLTGAQPMAESTTPSIHYTKVLTAKVKVRSIRLLGQLGVKPVIHIFAVVVWVVTIPIE